MSGPRSSELRYFFQPTSAKFFSFSVSFPPKSQPCWVFKGMFGILSPTIISRKISCGWLIFESTPLSRSSTPSPHHRQSQWLFEESSLFSLVLHRNLNTVDLWWFFEQGYIVPPSSPASLSISFLVIPTRGNSALSTWKSAHFARTFWYLFFFVGYEKQMSTRLSQPGRFFGSFVCFRSFAFFAYERSKKNHLVRF